MRTRKITAEVVLRVFTRTTMTPRPRAVTPILFAVGLCAVTFHVNCGEQLRYIQEDSWDFFYV